MTKYVTKYFFIILIFVVTSSVEMYGQTDRVISWGYEVPTGAVVAPGQVITFFVQGVGGSLTTPVRATTSPWPTSLANISVTVQPGALAAPIFEVRSLRNCPINAGTACIPVTAITVQIPYELTPPCNLCGIAAVRTQLFVTENGASAASIDLVPLPDKIHLLTLCDLTISGGGARGSDGFPCTSMVTHANGTLVSAANPAKAGEELVAWAFGLGQTSPAATTGAAAPTALPTVTQFLLDFNFHVNALPSKPTPIVAPPFSLPVNQPRPIFSGLTAGMVGLYQINFVVPEIPGGSTLPCTDFSQPVGNTTIVQTNLTVSIGSTSFDGAGICVAQ